ncbi:beta-ketoacyl-[acyl-carrier-protein] synthase family protein [Corallococcus sp. BB11-1]|uniref:beta-ketoacyl-[acyl-carrier-protein] synthase family protein n=1 Tax=Corallococcus sp. BB11-1 TaxID=2996783 RepID=UPI00227155A3|nr:beta-ketoacyl-[acyl-carrier-protein] synthase family protein [Corallococcus sp. BB11-1]MCY1035379.1 beta-ketoacyl-[acyl-carrier-protein] synthase family protein [Corallococcus sp. BB11-1]
MKTHKSRERRVVVTGMGIVAPNGVGLKDFWRNTLEGRSGIFEVDRFRLDGLKARIAGLVKDFRPRELGLREEQVRRLDRYAQFALAAARMATEDARFNLPGMAPERLGVCVANAICGTRFMEEEFLALTERGTVPLEGAWVQRWLYQGATFNTASAELAREYRALGPCFTVSTGCTAGLDAIGFALDRIRSNEADVMICGASEAPITPIAMGAFDVVGALSSKRNHAPHQASRPFDADRDGFVLGEGAGILVLEELQHARRRGVPIYAEVRGFGSCNNAFHMTDLPPDGHDLARALKAALHDASVRPEEVHYVSAHGSSTRQNDVNETTALKEILGAHAYSVPVSSLKSMVGHPLAAANALESISALLALHTGTLPPTINYETPDPACDLNYVPNTSVARKIDVVLKEASGFSGIHSALIFSHPEFVGVLR